MCYLNLTWYSLRLHLDILAVVFPLSLLTKCTKGGTHRHPPGYEPTHCFSAKYSASLMIVGSEI